MQLDSYIAQVLGHENLSADVPGHDPCTKAERDLIGKLLLEVSVDWKRILSPMLGCIVCQEALAIVLREHSAWVHK